MKSSFLEITDPEKRNLIVNDFLNTKKNMKESFLSERLGDIGLQRQQTKLYKHIIDSQSAQSAALSSTLEALRALPSSLKRAIQFPNYPSIQAKTDEEEPKESLIELGSIATQYLRSMAGKQSTDKTFGLYEKDGKFYIGDTEVTISMILMMGQSDCGS